MPEVDGELIFAGHTQVSFAEVRRDGGKVVMYRLPGGVYVALKLAPADDTAILSVCRAEALREDGSDLVRALFEQLEKQRRILRIE